MYLSCSKQVTWFLYLVSVNRIQKSDLVNAVLYRYRTPLTMPFLPYDADMIQLLDIFFLFGVCMSELTYVQRWYLNGYTMQWNSSNIQLRNLTYLDFWRLLWLSFGLSLTLMEQFYKDESLCVMIFSFIHLLCCLCFSLPVFKKNTY